MKIKYNIRPSAFLPSSKAALQQNSHTIQRGGLVLVNFASGGYNGHVKITIDPQNPSTFITDWSNTDATRFPARIKAAATALRDSGYVGRFEIRHLDGALEMRQA